MLGSFTYKLKKSILLHFWIRRQNKKNLLHLMQKNGIFLNKSIQNPEL